MDAMMIGRRRQGKTSLALYVARAHHPTVIAFDPNNQFRRFGLYPTNRSNFRAWLQMASAHPGELWETAFQPRPEALPEDLDFLVAELKDYCDYAIIIDESEAVQSSLKPCAGMSWLSRRAPRDTLSARFGERSDVSIIQTTHRAVDVSRASRAILSDVWIFQTSDRLDLERISQDYGEEISLQVAHLKRFESLHWWLDYGGERRYSIWRDTRWYSTLGASSGFSGGATTSKRGSSGRSGDEAGGGERAFA